MNNESDDNTSIKLEKCKNIPEVVKLSFMIIQYKKIFHTIGENLINLTFDEYTNTPEFIRDKLREIHDVIQSLDVMDIDELIKFAETMKKIEKL